MTIWDQLGECVETLSEPFSAQEILSWFRRHYPTTKESSLRAHIQAATSNAGGEGRPAAFGGRRPLITRVGHGLYVRYQGTEPEASPRPWRRRESRPSTQSPGTSALSLRPTAAAGAGDGSADLYLVGCCKTKAPTAAPARELFRGAGFVGAQEVAEGAGRPWHILSARWGLIDPDEIVAPYDVYLADLSAGYRRAWGEWVVAQLAERHTLRGLRAEVHAGAAYVNPLRAPAERAGLRLVTPLEGLTRGERLSWYAARSHHPKSLPAPLTTARGPSRDDEVIAYLGNPANAVELETLAHLRDALGGPGLYTWWIDHEGAAELTVGLGHLVEAGLLYLGQAGATKWPSGKRSKNTLWGRLAGMHLGDKADMSTLRRSLGGTLAAARGAMITESDLSTWMRAHLRVAPLVVADRDTLHALEERVLAALDPPFNLRHASRTRLRTALKRLRRAGGQPGQQDSPTVIGSGLPGEASQTDLIEKADPDAHRRSRT